MEHLPIVAEKAIIAMRQFKDRPSSTQTALTNDGRQIETAPQEIEAVARKALGISVEILERHDDLPRFFFAAVVVNVLGNSFEIQANGENLVWPICSLKTLESSAERVNGITFQDGKARLVARNMDEVPEVLWIAHGLLVMGRPQHGSERSRMLDGMPLRGGTITTRVTRIVLSTI